MITILSRRAGAVLGLALALATGIAAASDMSTAREIDRQISATVDQLNQELARGQAQLEARPAQPNPYGTMADIDNEFRPTIAQVNRQLEMAQREIRNRWDRERLQQSLTMQIPNSPEYNRIQGELNRLDQDLAQLNRDLSNQSGSSAAMAGASNRTYTAPTGDTMNQTSSRPVVVTRFGDDDAATSNTTRRADSTHDDADVPMTNSGMPMFGDDAVQEARRHDAADTSAMRTNRATSSSTSMDMDNDALRIPDVHEFEPLHQDSDLRDWN